MSPSVSRRGVVIVLVLFTLAVLLLSGLGLLGSRALRQAGTRQQQEAAQAAWLAQAGLEDARVKLAKRLDFPPPGAMDQTTYSYSERLVDSRGAEVGHYVVTLDSTQLHEPFYLLRITSEGMVGPRQSPRASRVLTATLDLRGDDRFGEGLPTSPRLFQWVDWNDGGIL